jgi:hypothetical protein
VSPGQALEQQRGEIAPAVQYTEDINTIDIKPVDNAPSRTMILSIREHAELFQLWNKAPASRQECEIFRGTLKPVEDGERVFDAGQ